MNFDLTKIVESDWAFFKQLYSTPSVLKYIADPMSEAQIRAAFEHRLPDWNLTSTHWLCFVIRDKESAMPMGLTGFKLFSENDQLIAEVGYIIAPEQAGKSLATKSLKALLEHPEFTAIKKFQAVVSNGNDASEKVLIKNGFRCTEVIKDNYIIGGIAFDDHIYTLIR